MNAEQPITILQYLALIHEISYAKVSKDVGVTPQQFTDWVKKRRPVPKERLDMLAQYFGIEPHELVEESFYLLDLTEKRKVDIQIGFLRQKLKQSDDQEIQEAYQDKLEKLYKEKEQLQQIDRFAKAYKDGDEQTRQLCRLFLDKIEQGSESQLARLLRIEE